MSTSSIKSFADIAGIPYGEIGATVGAADGQDILFLNEDYSGENLTCYIATGPGFEAIAELSCTVTLDQSQSWQHYIDCEGLRAQDIPCEVDKTAYDTTNPDVSVISVLWSATSLNRTPRPTIADKPVDLFYEIRRTDGTGPIFAMGKFSVLRKIENA